MTPSPIAPIQKILDTVSRHITDPVERRQMTTYLLVACEALVGLDRSPDTGPWTVSSDGRTISSGNFKHDVVLQVTGDFYTDADRRAYALALAERLNRV